MEPFITINNRPFPYPKRGMDFITTTVVDSGRNISAEVVGQKIGRDQYKLNELVWPALPADQWAAMLQELDKFFVYVKFPDQVRNTWVTLKMYPGDRSAQPYWLDETTGLPKMYINCKVNLIDAGSKDNVLPPIQPQYKLQTKTVYPTNSQQSIKPDSPQFYGLGEVIVKPGTNTNDGTATSADILKGKTAYARGARLTGTIPVKSGLAVNLTLDTPSVWIDKAYYNRRGYAMIDRSIETRLSQI